MVNAARLNIDIDVDLHSSIPNLNRLAETLLDVAESQLLVDERMRIRVNVRGLAELTALNSQLSTLAPQQALAMGMAMGGGFGGGGGSGGGFGGGFDTDDAGRFSLRMSSLHNALADIIPLLLVLIAALPALIAALGGLAAAAIGAAGALGAIAGLGLMGVVQDMEGPAMENLQSIAEDVFEDFQEAFEPLADVFAPTFMRALGGLERFFDDLAARGDTLVDLRDDAISFGRFMIDFTTTAIERLAALADAAAPIFGMIAQWLEDTNITNAFAQALRRALPELAAMARAFVNMLPGLTRLSQGFLVAATAIMMLFGGLFSLIDLLGPFGEGLGVIIGLLATAVSIASLYGTVLNAITMLKTALASTVIPGMVGSLWSSVTAFLASASAAWQLAAAIGAIIGIATLGVGLTAIVGVFANMSNQIDNATSSLKEFGSVSNRMDTSIGAGGAASGGGSTVYQEYSPSYEVNAGSVSEGNRVARRVSYREGTATDSAFTSG